MLIKYMQTAGMTSLLQSLLVHIKTSFISTSSLPSSSSGNIKLGEALRLQLSQPR
ncbi:hypothetical protein HanIR_Chr11g0507951 [Helianthus annuus]|nr:hypothetical protein HanIR_Chr11g0507951 [Helianthus annuus]